MTIPKITIYPNALPGFANGNIGSSGYVPSYGRNPLLGPMNPVPPMMAAMDANPVRDAGMLNQSRYNAKLAFHKHQTTVSALVKPFFAWVRQV